MDTETTKDLFSWIQDIGSAGVVVVVVLIFLKYIHQRDQAIQDALDKLTNTVSELTTWLRSNK